MTEVIRRIESLHDFQYSHIDFNNTVTRDCLNHEILKTKLSLCQEYFETQDEERKTEILNMILKDPTMFSYVFFKLNNKPLKVFSYQDLILNDHHKYKIFRAARQIGKSLALDIKAAHNLCINHGHDHNECIISASLTQATFQMSRVKQLLNTANFDWKEDKGPQDNMSIITVNILDKYINRLVVAPPTESALGYDFHSVNLDEVEYWKDIDVNHFFSLIEPTIIATDGEICTFSNPNGAETFIAEQEELRLKNGNKKWHVYVFNFFDRPGATQDQFEMVTVGKTRQQIESQFLAIRSISSKNYFTTDEIDRSYDPSLTELDMVGKQPFAFLDVGAKHDASVLVMGYIDLDSLKLDANGEPIKHFKIPIIHNYPIGYPLARVVGGEASDDDGWHHEKSVKEYMQEWSVGGIVPTLGVDCTGNSGIVPLMELVGLNPIDITFSGPAKSGMFQRAKYLFEKGLIHRIKHEQLEYELSHMIMKKSARGYLTIHHEREDDHDDCVDALVGFIHISDDPNFISPSLVLF